MSEGEADETGDYLLQIERVPLISDSDIPILPSNVRVTDRIGLPTDVDVFRIPGGGRLTIASLTPGLDLRVEFFDDDDDVFSTFCVGGSGANAVTCLAYSEIFPFEYVIKLSDVGADETGEYVITLDCESTSACGPDNQVLGLSVEQPHGPGSLRIESKGGIPNALYVTAFSRLGLNDSLPGHGWWGGLHINLQNLVDQAFSGSPLIGLLRENGQTRFDLPAGGLPPLPPDFRLHWVTRTVSPTFDAITETSNVVSITLR